MAPRFLVVAIVALLVPSCIAKNILYANEILYTGQSLYMGSYRFTMQADCNLVLYANEHHVWASGTYGKGSNCNLLMGADGNLVIFSGSKTIWESNTTREVADCVLVLKSDRNVVIYGPAIWDTNTDTVTFGAVITGQMNGTRVDPKENTQAPAGEAMVTANN